MDEITTSVVAGLIIAVVGWIAGGLWRQLKMARAALKEDVQRKREHEELMAYMRGRQAHDRLVDEGLRTLLLCNLETMQDHMVYDNHGIASNDMKFRAQRIYDAYHSLGGNGHGTQVNADIQDAPIAPKPSTPDNPTNPTP
ncbi:hypothetical protein [Bifidobacterium callitrichos]|uniref:hypothetical protein n=1 Tax=Bifidobacterium callitrichos TaxID=762209 RepID=UPI0005BD5F8E|nr:hypothetical protein [Bifidobacterium callitrichos]